MPLCTCGHPVNEQIYGLCSWLLDCLCRGYIDTDTYSDMQGESALSNADVEALVAWIRTHRARRSDEGAQC
jgi:hypothetical protein